MPIRPFRTHFGGKLSAKELRRLQREAERQAKTLGGSGVASHGTPGGQLIVNERDKPFWARISGAASKTTTTLSSGINSSTTTIPVASASGFPASENYRIKIDDEILEVTAGQGTTSWTATRGFAGTTAASHASGATVTLRNRAFAWAEQIDATTIGIFNDDTVTRSGTTTNAPAYEVSGETEVPTGARVRLFVGKDLEYYVFRYTPECCDGATQSSLKQTTDTLSTSQNNYTIPAQSQWHKITTSAAVSITGFDRQSVTNKTVEITNAAASTDAITIPHQSGSSSAGNQVDTPYGQSVVIPPGETIKLKHDTSGTGRWKFAERPATLVESGAGTPSHTAPQGTLYFETIVENVYVNTDGSTTWRLVAGPSVHYDRLSSQTYSETSITGNTTLTYGSHGDAWNRCSGSGPYTVTFFTPSAGFFIGLIAATTLTGTVTLSGSFDTPDGQKSSLELKAGWSYEFMGLSSRWRMVSAVLPGDGSSGNQNEINFLMHMLGF